MSETILMRKKLNMELIYKTNTFKVLEVAPVYRYENNTKTDDLEGYRYTVGDTNTFDKFQAKVPGQTPACEQKDIDASIAAGTPLFIQFKNLVNTPYPTYVSGTVVLNDKITADSAAIVRNGGTK